MTECGYPNDLDNTKWSGSNLGLVSDVSRVLFQLSDGTVVLYVKNT